ncbi:MAG: outer membrane beta-barrel protein [Tannerella sp.]|jgi:opacity protein-like surface antigen|nr:outer membrane beta-barrel protein [Tannerella sp.]
MKSKKLILVLCILSVSPAGFAQSKTTAKETATAKTAPATILKPSGEKGVSSIGGILGYGVDNKSFLIGVDFRYNLRDKIRMAPSVSYLFEKDNLSTWYMNMDFHYLTRITNKTTVYPVGGLGLSVWKYNYSTVLWDIDDTVIRLGLNLGYGVETRITDDILIGAEFRYNLTAQRKYDQAMFAFRCAYYF